jgi:hypothetical protein
VAGLKASEAISVTMRLPRRAWPDELNTSIHCPRVAVNLLRGRLTCRQAVVVIRVEGSILGTQEVLHRWECCGFKLEEGDRNGIQDSLRDTGNRLYPLSLYGRGNPSGGSRHLSIRSS